MKVILRPGDVVERRYVAPTGEGWESECTHVTYDKRRGWLRLEHICEIVNPDGRKTTYNESEAGIILFSDYGQPIC